MRLPSYPIFTFDPYFSLWSGGDELSASPTTFWHGEPKPLYGGVIADGVRYPFLGERGLKQTAVRAGAFTTEYSFRCKAFALTVAFCSPVFPDDPDRMARPVGYMSYRIEPYRPIGGFTVYLAAEERLCYDTFDEPDKREAVTGGVLREAETVNVRDGDTATAFIGRTRQYPLSHAADGHAADWGWYYVTGGEAGVTRGDRTYAWAINRHAGDRTAEGFLTLAYDDVVSLLYFGRPLKGWYFRGGRTIADAIAEARADFTYVTAKCAEYDRFIEEQTDHGPAYARILCASLRQSIAAHKAVADERGRLLFVSYECNSDGCAATSDISYPSSPLFLLFNPELVKGMLYPILEFARMPVWEFPFAPHDAGVYPYVEGQFYAVKGGIPETVETLPPYWSYSAGQGLYVDDKHMPVEESGNMLLLSAAAARFGGDAGWLDEYMPLLRRWADYLAGAGVKLEKQLCTDDFAGPLENNCNLAIKSAVALMAFARLLEECGDSGEAARYEQTARRFAAEIMASSGAGTPLYFGGENTRSLKYNLAFDALLGLDLFPAAYLEREADACLAAAMRYGTPLDSRSTRAKTDWQYFTAALTRDKSKRAAILERIALYMDEADKRVPFGDYYDADTAHTREFQNRTVQGAAFILLLVK